MFRHLALRVVGHDIIIDTQPVNHQRDQYVAGVTRVASVATVDSKGDQGDRRG